MAEITEEGYQNIRDYIESNWIYHSLRDNSDDEIVRIDTDDSRTEWTHDSESQVLELTTTVAGEDSDISPPQEFAGSEIYDGSSGGDPYADETFESFTIETDSDELTVKHRIEVPEVT